MNTLPPGSIISLEQPPKFVIVQLHDNIDDDNDHTTDNEDQQKKKSKLSKHMQKRIRALRKLAITTEPSDSRILIPLQPSNNSKWQSYTIPSKQFQYGVSRVNTRNVLPFELSFAMTVHKAQGRTLRTVILALSHRGFDSKKLISFESIYVAMSRVRSHNDIRLLFHETNEKAIFNRIAEIGYLTDLKPCKYTQAYYNGFDENQEGYWDWNKTKQYMTMHDTYSS